MQTELHIFSPRCITAAKNEASKNRTGWSITLTAHVTSQKTDMGRNEDCIIKASPVQIPKRSSAVIGFLYSTDT